MAKGWGGSLLVGALVGAVYVATAAPGLVWGDGIELAAVCASLGIAHPTSYPLFTLLGHLFTYLPFGAIPFRVTLFCTFSMVLAVILMHRLLILSFSSLAIAGGPVWQRRWWQLAPMAGALGFGWSLGPWTHATRTEVYALQLLLQSGLVLLSWHWLRGQVGKGDQGWSRRGAAYGASCLLGLGFAHHLLTVVLVPLWGAVVWRHLGKAKAWRRRCLGHALALLLGLSPILYLPLRALQEPALSWGNPADLEGLWWTLSGGDFPDKLLLVEQPGRTFTVGSFAVHLAQRGRAVASYLVGMVMPLAGLPVGVRLLTLLLMSLCLLKGMRHLWRYHRTFAIPWGLSLGLYSGVLVSYNIGDITDYQLGYFSLLWPVAWWGACLTVCGDALEQGGDSAWWRRFAASRAGWSAVAAMASALFLLPLALLVGNFALADRSDETLVDRFAEIFLRELPANAILLTQGDFTTATAWYRQTVLEERRDILVYCLDFFYDDWYAEVLARQELRGRRVATSGSGGELGEPFLVALDRLIVTPNPGTPILIMPSPRQALALERHFDLRLVASLLDAEEMAAYGARGWRAPQPLVFQLSSRSPEVTAQSP